MKKVLLALAIVLAGAATLAAPRSAAAASPNGVPGESCSTRAFIGVWDSTGRECIQVDDM